MITIYPADQRSEAWFDIKNGKFSGSTFKNLLASKSTKTYTGLIYKIASEILSGETEETFTSYAMQRGTDMEDEAVVKYNEIYGNITEEVGFITNDDIHPKYVGVSPDRLIGDDGLLEVKCPLPQTQIMRLVNKVLPPEYAPQVHGQMLISGRDYCDFMSYHPNFKPFIIRVERDKKMDKLLTDRINEAVNEVEDIIKKLS